MLAFAVLALSAAHAADTASADALYRRRDEPRNLERSIAVLDDLLKASPDDAELLWRKGRSLMRRGEKRERKSDRLTDYRAAEELLKRSVALKPEAADAHYFYGVAMGRRGEAQGILKSLFLIKPIRREMSEALRLDPGHGGAHRVLGEILWQVPGFAGGDKKKALAEFEASVRLCPACTENYLPLAEAYREGGRKDDAVRVLKQGLEVKEPADPASAAEDLADLRKLLGGLAP